jgi:hypothetical protein
VAPDMNTKWGAQVTCFEGYAVNARPLLKGCFSLRERRETRRNKGSSFALLYGDQICMCCFRAGRKWLYGRLADSLTNSLTVTHRLTGSLTHSLDGWLSALSTSCCLCAWVERTSSSSYCISARDVMETCSQLHALAVQASGSLHKE